MYYVKPNNRFINPDLLWNGVQLIFFRLWMYTRRPKSWCKFFILVLATLPEASIISRLCWAYVIETFHSTLFLPFGSENTEWSQKVGGSTL